MDVDPEFLAELRRLHSRGWDDRKIARARKPDLVYRILDTYAGASRNPS